MTNPDDPDGDELETSAWWDPADLPSMPALRDEVRLTPWHLLAPPTTLEFASKASKASVDYEHPAGIPAHNCGACTHFQAPAACTQVAGAIRPEDWCKLWNPVEGFVASIQRLEFYSPGAGIINYIKATNPLAGRDSPDLKEIGNRVDPETPLHDLKDEEDRIEDKSTKMAVLSVIEFYSSDQSRDSDGRFGSGVQPESWQKDSFSNKLNNRGQLVDQKARTAEFHGREWVSKNIDMQLTRAGRVAVGESDKAAVKRYQEVEGYKAINGALRQGNVSADAKGVDEAIKAFTTKDDVVVFRGVGKGVLDTVKVGDHFTDKGFTSASIFEQTTRAFGGKNTVAEITVPKGSHMLPADVVQPGISMGEMVLGSGSKFRIDSVGNEGGTRRVKMTYVG